MLTPNNILPEESEKTDIVLRCLMQAKHEMGSAVKKDASNPFHKSKYASLGAHLDLCEEVLYRNGLLMIQCPNMINGVPVLVAKLSHPGSGQWVKSYLPLPNPKGDSQGIGASLTYMRRYSINSMLGLNAEDDDGETASGRGQYAKKEAAEAPKAAAKEPMKIIPAQIYVLRNLEKKLDDECKTKIYAWLEKQYKITKFEEISNEIYQKVLSAMENAVKFLEQQKTEAVANA